MNFFLEVLMSFYLSGILFFDMTFSPSFLFEYSFRNALGSLEARLFSVREVAKSRREGTSKADPKVLFFFDGGLDMCSFALADDDY